MFKFSLLISLMMLTACASKKVDLFENKDLSAFHQIGNANWRIEEEVMIADKGVGYLVSKNSFDNFVLTVEFKAEKGTNSGVFFRCEKGDEITDKICYEANIFDTRGDQKYRTGAIVEVIPPKVKVDTEDGQWHTYVITTKKSHITVVLDGQETVSFENNLHRSGPIALQFVAGKIQFRRVEITGL